jgi:hypothetical protein
LLAFVFRSYVQRSKERDFSEIGGDFFNEKSVERFA